MNRNEEIFNELWIASANQSKSRELVDFSKTFFPEIREVKTRGAKDVVESEPSFEGNAKLKALALAGELLKEGKTDFLVLGDDSGLCVELLDGKPGVHSARYSTPDPSPEKNLEKLLKEINSITHEMSKRQGRYHCALYLVQVGKGKILKEFGAHGEREGLIGMVPKGANGYAYDSIFLDPHNLQSYGELSYEEKQKDSHRHRAFKNLRKIYEVSYL